ncbi:phage integrase N-terminal domain-containing protein [Oricola sp.]|uniref:phage integrase N-terminal domain-containing protein n=1 Tax=Oricola sp. TaxID=1979950 RepID=UPI0025FA00F1|nr:phage integrase N-terminal domain-containing protein [Oricola sp.]MCI5076855.1 integrase domain-containing protein [Oricola sp.]
MDNLTMDLVQLCRRNRDGSYGTQKNRQRGLTAIAGELDSLGYKLPSTRSIKPKHVAALIEKWQGSDLDDATIRNRLTWLRWWAEKVDKRSVISRDNADYGVAARTGADINRAKTFKLEKYRKIPCAHIRAAILLQASFGLRREEAMKFRPDVALRNDHIALKASWTKGGRPRTIPITTDMQRRVLQRVSRVAKGGSLIPANLTYAEQLKRYEYQTLNAGMRNTHGFRHAYAQHRYEALTGMQCPLNGGKRWQEMTAQERQADRAARRQISGELGHGRLEVTDTYLGRALS